MEPLVSDEGYVFTPYRESRFWPWLLGLWLPHHLKKTWGIEEVRFRGVDRLQASIAAGHGIMLTPNHCRPCDPLMLGELRRQMGVAPTIMASAHLFRARKMGWLLPRVGAFSMNREGMDRESLKMAMSILTEAKRPLVIFPEGVITRTNDRVIHLQEGISFLARTAAKARAAQGGQLVIHPLAMRYEFLGDLERSVKPVIENLEKRFGWKPAKLPLLDRVARLGYGLLGLKEVEYFGVVQEGSLDERLARFMDWVLCPMEKEYATLAGEESVVMRVKNLRKAILPRLMSGGLDEAGRERCWKQLFDLEVTQQAYHFPPDYIRENPTPERIIETVERYEEVLGRKNPTVYRPMRLTVSVGEAIVVEGKRERGAADPLMGQVREQLRAMLAHRESTN